MPRRSAKIGKLIRIVIILSIVASVLLTDLYEIRIPKPPHVSVAFANKPQKFLFSHLFV